MPLILLTVCVYVFTLEERTPLFPKKTAFLPSRRSSSTLALLCRRAARLNPRGAKRATQKRVDGVTEKWMAFSNSHMISSLSRRLPYRPGVEASDIAAKSPGDSVKTYPSLKDGR